MGNRSATKVRSVFMRESFLVGLVSCCVAVAIVLSVLYTQFDDKSSIDAKLAQLGHSAVLWRGENHEVIGFDNSTESFSYVVFTDPQYGLRDMTDDNGDGTEWQHDRSNMRLLCEKINALEPKPQFIFITGDLSNARPESNEEITPGFMSSYRSPQQIDLLTDLGLFDKDIPILVNTGNHDINESPDKVTVGAHERVWGDAYFSFWVKGQIFLALESQFFRSEDPVTKEFAKEEIQWLTELLSEMPKETPKTIMIHVPLFIRTPDETDSEIDGKTIPIAYRSSLLELFCANGVRRIYSGHTHMTTKPEPIQCGNHELQQIVLTSINAQLDWQSNTVYYPKGKPEYIVVEADAVDHKMNFVDLL